MTMKVNVLGAQDNERVAVFGMSEEQHTVHGNPLYSYEEITNEVGGVSFIIEPASPKVLVRCRSQARRWRYDKQIWCEATQTYTDDLVFEYKDEVIEIDLDEYFEHDWTIDEHPTSPPIFTVKEHNSYETLPQGSKYTAHQYFPNNSSLPDAKKNLIFEIDGDKRIELEHFKHKLPREINWLLYGPLPKGSGGRTEGVFFYYPFGVDKGIDESVVKREPWRLDVAWIQEAEKAKSEFVELIAGWGESPKYLSTRELSMQHPRFLRQEGESSLRLQNMYGGNNPKVWHYFSFPKFAHFLNKKEIWFCRPSVFTDPFESRTNKATRAHQIQIVLRQLIEEYNIAVREQDDNFIQVNSIWADSLPRNDDGVIVTSEVETFSDVNDALRLQAEDRLDKINDSFLINCWHENESESDAMWGLYSSREFGVAVTSTPDKIREAFEGNNINLNVTPIEYHDLHSSGDVFDSLPVSYKHEAFQHEKEYRIYLSGYPLTLDKKGISIPVSIETLIDKVVLSPTAPQWFRDVVESSVQSAGLEIEINDSIFKNSLF